MADGRCGMCGAKTEKLTLVREHGSAPVHVCKTCLDCCCEDAEPLA